MATPLAIATAAARNSKSLSVKRLLSKPSIITLGGLNASTHQFAPIHLALWRSGRFGVFPVHYDGFNYGIDENGAALAKLIERRLERHGDEPHCRESRLHFVTHSYGALVLRSAMRQIGWDGKGCRVVMIAPCNRGSVLARRLCDWNCGSLLLGSLAAKELGQNNEAYFDEIGDMPKLAKVRVIAGTGGFGNPLLPRGSSHDGRVLVSETKLRTPHDHFRVRSTHGFMMYHPRVVRMTKDFIHGTDRGLAAWSSRSREDEDYLSSTSSPRRRTGEDHDDSDEDEDSGGPGAAVAAVAEAVRMGAGSGEELKVDERDREQAERVRERRRRRRSARGRDLRAMQAEGSKHGSELECDAALSRSCRAGVIAGSEGKQCGLESPASGVPIPMVLQQAAEHGRREPCMVPCRALLPGMQAWRAEHMPPEAFV